MRILSFTFLLSVLALCSKAQTKATRLLQEANDENTSLYFYQSTLRALAMEISPKLTQLAGDIDKITLVTLSNDSSGIDRSIVDQYLAQIKQEGFEEVMAMNGPNGISALYAIGAEEPEDYVGIIASEEKLIVADMQGKLDVALLYSLDSSEFEKLSKVVEAQGIGK